MVRRVVLGVLVGLLVLVGPVPAQAQEQSGSILVIMDVSGSMQRKDGTGTTLVDGARQAVRGLVSSLPAEVPVGLRLYGHTYPGANERQGCRDTELVVPIAARSESGDAIVDAVDGATPTGFTPIGVSLAQAARDFPPEGERTIVLVSDGEDTCGDPSPCQAAKQLARQGIAVRVDTVGLFLQGNAKARQQLQCVARATGGTYVTADDAGELSDRLAAASQRALQRFEASGARIEGGPAATQATPIEPGQAYVDDVRAGESRWYAVPATVGQDVSVTFTEDGSSKYGCCLTVWLRDPDFERIASDNGFNSGGTARSVRVSSYDGGVRDDGTHFVEVTLDEDQADRPVTYEFRVDVTGGAVEPSASPSASASASAGPTEEPSPAASPEPAEADDVEAAAADSGGGNTLLWVVIVVLLLVVAALGGYVAKLSRAVARSKE